MKQQIKHLCDLRPGERGVVDYIHISGDMRRRLLDIGLVENTEVICIGESPGRDPSAYLIRGAVIAIRKKDAKSVFLKAVL
ncbi:MAG: ferrous iron transport protein A [Clostridia bacterium]|nr:ferrous iron transport protein A [Clostridia bacterium]